MGRKDRGGALYPRLFQARTRMGRRTGGRRDSERKGSKGECVCLWINRKGERLLLKLFVHVCECVLVRKGDAERKSSPEGRVR